MSTACDLTAVKSKDAPFKATAPPPPALVVSGLEVSINGSRILRGVNLEVTSGNVVCLMGRNGVGKSTTLKTVVGLQSTTRGAIWLHGREITRCPPDQRARLGIGYVPQGREIFPHLTVRENLELGAIALKKKRAANYDRVFTLFPILREFLLRKGGTLSGGQQQQLAIARALLIEPTLLILDEPTEGIQPNVIDQIGDAIGMLRREGTMTILLVEQYLDFARELADDFYVMERGVIAAHGPIAHLTESVVREYLTV